MPKLPMIIIYVADQQRSAGFYKAILNKEPVLDVPGMTEFQLTNDVLLGIMPENSIAKILADKTPHPSTGNGIPRCELYLFSDDTEKMYERALKVGAKEISKIQDRDWGDSVGYLADPDGHIIALAKKKTDNP
ncbi:MAG: VOC family protein [Sphingobacteriaceae bacterium]|nr:VOC family protein [Sphingobacteriaceae bacterium]